MPTDTPREPAPAERPRIARLRRAFERGVDWLFEGKVDALVYALMRIGIALIFLVRHADWLRPWFALEHHRFVRGVMHLDSLGVEPRLASPMISGLSLGDGATRALVHARTALAFLLLLGIRPRLAALALAVTSYALLLADRYRYYHHLHLLYVTLAWLALCPLGARFSLDGAVRRALAALRSRPKPELALLRTAPAWPLQLIRALVLSVYLAAGLSKLDASWLRGDALRELERANVLGGTLWQMLKAAVGYGGVATLSCLTELLLPLGLAFRPTRRASVGCAWLFHAAISACMPVYSFGAQMALLLLAFFPVRLRDGSAPVRTQGTDDLSNRLEARPGA